MQRRARAAARPVRAAWALRVVLLSLGALLGLTGCPREPDAPAPGMGTPCEQLSDCNPGRSCGALKLCVDGFCEEGETLIRPCRDQGEPVRPPGRD